MKLLVRFLGITLVCLIVSLALIYLANTSIIINELNECSSLAMKQTQSKMKEFIIATINETSSISFNYEDYYLKCFNDTVKDPSIYEVNISCDETKGIIYVEIDVPSYHLIPSKRLLNIVDLVGEGLDDIDGLKTEKTTKSVKNKLGLSDSKLTSHVLKSYPTSYDGKIRTYNYSLNIFATYGSSSTALAGPAIEIRCTDKDDKVNIIDSGEGGKSATVLKGSETCDCKLFEIVLAKDFNKAKYDTRIDKLVSDRNSVVTEVTTTITKKANFNIEDYANISTRYINDINSLDMKSIWLINNDYRSVLIKYLEVLNEKIN